ncbi:hypothetical protein [Flavivirga eckloniae]|uniref:hypothetical protein n=1 Tax=Flavivirga eckloniae TaxID=1803846 RepID=UPI0013156B0A|nr:hypothetical protein [Flavivirga eckloniae]
MSISIKKIKDLEKENLELKLRLSILNQTLIMDSDELIYLKLLIDEIVKTA